MIREAAAQDQSLIAAFLGQHITTSMFLMSNLEQHGIGQSDHPHATRYFMSFDGAQLQGVFGCTRSGYLMCQHPGLTQGETRVYLRALGGQSVQGITGINAQVDHFVSALSHHGGAWQKDSVEPLFSLPLAKLPLPSVRICSPTPNHRDMLIAWYRAHLAETGLPNHIERCAEMAERAIADDRTRLLIGPEHQPIGMTSLNACAGSAVQVGGVHVLPAHRGQGHAGRMVAAHLLELRQKGADTAILFAASDSAAKAYRRIGFQQIGHYRIAMLRDALMIGEAA